MKKNSVLILIVILALSLSACGTADTTEVEENVRAVEVMEAKISEKEVTKNYIGTVESKNLIKYSFKTAGKINEIFVKEGQSIKKGDKLASLDLEDLNYQLEAAKSQMEAANKDIKKAKDDYTYKQDLFNKMKSLYEEGSISKDKFDQVKLARDVSESTYNQAMSQYSAANSSYEQVKSLTEDAVIYSTQDGSVVSTEYEPREMVAAGYPVVVIRSDSQVINVGLVQKDLDKIKVGTKAIVDIEGVKASGEIITIAEAPDKMTRTYKAEILVKEKKYRIGSIANVKLEDGKRAGVWLPLNIIMSNGVDYVFIIDGDRSFKRMVELKELNNDLVRVDGIEVGEKVVLIGMKNINDGSKIKIVK